MTTSQQIVERGAARSTQNDLGKLAKATAELLPYVNSVFQRLYALWAVADPEAAGSLATLVLAGSPPSVTLPTDVIDVRRVDVTGTVSGEVNLVPVTERDRRWHLAPRVYRRGASIVSNAGTGDPAAGDTLTLQVLDAPATLSALASVIDARFPVRFHTLLELMVAVYLAVKDDGRDPAHYRELMAQLDMELRGFAALTGVSLTALRAVHAETARERSAVGV